MKQNGKDSKGYLKIFKKTTKKSLENNEIGKS